MVEAAAALLKESLEECLSRNVEDLVNTVRKQQVDLVGGEAIYERLDRHLKNQSEDLFFLKEQLALFKYRLDFFTRFFPEERISPNYVWPNDTILSHLSTYRPGWWHCKGALVAKGSLVAKVFDKVVEKAFHMTTESCCLDERTSMDFDSVIQEGRHYDRKFNHYVSDNEHEDIKKMVLGSTVEDEKADRTYLQDVRQRQQLHMYLRVYDEGGNSFSYLKRIIWALHKDGPSSLKQLAARKILLENLPQDTLPKTLVEYLENGPFPKLEELTPRGQRVFVALGQEEIEMKRSLEERKETIQQLKDENKGLKKELAKKVEERRQEKHNLMYKEKVIKQFTMENMQLRRKLEDPVMG